MKEFFKYPTYQSSGIEWLGEVPSHWTIKRLKYNFSVKTEKAVTDDNPIALENIESWTGRFLPTNSEFEGDGITFKEGDILFGKLRPYLAKVFLAEGNGEAVGDMFVMAPRQTVFPKFATYLFRTKDFIEIIDGSTFGSKMPRASWDFMGNLPFLLPSLPEQKAIATFLDRETERIDGLIGKREKLIVLLQEKRAALISHAVTKGLNPSAKMKPSGIDWLGDIPAHWEVKRLKYNFSLKTERFVTDENPIALENIESWTGRFIPTNSEFEGDGMAFKQGDILFGKLRPYLAKVFLAERNGEAIGDLFVMAPRQTVCPKFAAYLFRTRDFIEIIDGSTFGSKMPRASWGFVGNMPFPLSPLSEQNAIATYLDAETKKIDGLMEREQQIIERMKEYRSALISAAVTGKIDVRGSV